MEELIERLKICCKRDKAILIRGADAQLILLALGIRLWK